MIQKNTCTSVFIATLFTIPRHGNNLMSTDRGIDKKMCSIYTIQYSSAIKKKAIMPFAATWMDLESVTLTEVKSEKDILYMWNLKRI